MTFNLTKKKLINLFSIDRKFHFKSCPASKFIQRTSESKIVRSKIFDPPLFPRRIASEKTKSLVKNVLENNYALSLFPNSVFEIKKCNIYPKQATSIASCSYHIENKEVCNRILRSFSCQELLISPHNIKWMRKRPMLNFQTLFLKPLQLNNLTQKRPAPVPCEGAKKAPQKVIPDNCKRLFAPPCGTKKNDPIKLGSCGKKDPCKKPSSGSCGKKEDPCKKKDDACKKPSAVPCVKKDPCKKAASGPCGKKPNPCKKATLGPCGKNPNPCKKASAGSCGKKDDPCKKKQDPCKKKDDPCKKPASGPCGKKEDPCKKKDDPCKKKDDPCKKKDDPCKKKEDPCKKKDDPCKKKDDPCKKKEDPCKKKDDPCKKKDDPCKKKDDPCKKKDDPCKKKEDPCKKKESPCGKKADPCGDKKSKVQCGLKDDPCKKKC